MKSIGEYLVSALCTGLAFGITSSIVNLIFHDLTAALTVGFSVWAVAAYGLHNAIYPAREF